MNLDVRNTQSGIIYQCTVVTVPALNVINLCNIRLVQQLQRLALGEAEVI